MNSCNICVLLVVCTTSLIRKIDRALFTFWLYIICRRRCVILIFSVFFSLSFVYSFVRFTLICVCCWARITRTLSLALAVILGCLVTHSSMFTCALWPKCAIFFCASLLGNMIFRLLHYHCRYRYVSAVWRSAVLTNTQIQLNAARWTHTR